MSSPSLSLRSLIQEMMGLLLRVVWFVWEQFSNVSTQDMFLTIGSYRYEMFNQEQFVTSYLFRLHAVIFLKKYQFFFFFILSSNIKIEHKLKSISVEDNKRITHTR